MCKARWVFPFLLLLFFVQPLGAQFGWLKTKVSLPLRQPPEIYIPGRQVRLEVRSEVSGGSEVAEQFQRFLNQEMLRANFQLGGSHSGTSVRLVVNQFYTDVSRNRATELLRVNTGYHEEKDEKGKSRQVEDCELKSVEVTRLRTQGSLSLLLTLENFFTGVLLVDEIGPVDYYHQQTILGIQMIPAYSPAVAVPQLCTGGRIYDRGSSDFSNTASLENYLVQKAWTILQGKLERKLIGRVEKIEVLLAKPKELKRGNDLAVAHRWRQAIEEWIQVSITKRKTEAYRQYNFGVAFEALAYGTLDFGEMAEYLKNAEGAYNRAILLHPDERYFRQAFERLNKGRLAMERGQEHQARRQAEPALPPAMSQSQMKEEPSKQSIEKLILRPPRGSWW